MLLDVRTTFDHATSPGAVSSFSDPTLLALPEHSPPRPHAREQPYVQRITPLAR